VGHSLLGGESAELHPFHIHQAHFLAYAENGVPLARPAWRDTVNVPYRSSVDVIPDLTAPVIKGMSVFHCHLLNHEDKGMMAKILFKKLARTIPHLMSLHVFFLYQGTSVLGSRLGGESDLNQINGRSTAKVERTTFAIGAEKTGR
jgi:hypothetical protein